MRLLEIVRVLATGADLLLLDEPTAGVSPRMKEEVAAFIAKVQGLGKTVLVIEHDINFIQKFCRRIVVLESGQVVLDDTPERVRADERLQEIYFGTT
jgi:ABC-type branched-subunit amino acid transport system ATPase component